MTTFIFIDARELLPTAPDVVSDDGDIHDLGLVRIRKKIGKVQGHVYYALYIYITIKATACTTPSLVASCLYERCDRLSSSSAFSIFGVVHRFFNTHALRSCTSFILTPFPNVTFLITPLHLSFGLPIF